MKMVDKKSEILAYLFGGVFMSIFLFLLSKLIYRIYTYYMKERDARRHTGILLANSLYQTT